MKISTKIYCLIPVVLTILSPISKAQDYKVGDIVDDYTFIDHRTGEETSLYELGENGGVLVLEWFAWWCPFCNNAAANTETGIVEYYEMQGGNPHGLNVEHISLNVQGGAKAKTDTFIQTYNLGTVIEDHNRDFFSKFSPGGGQPLFAIINAEPNSPTAEQWEVLFIQLTYLSNPDISAIMRPVIDSVEAGTSEGDPFVELFGTLEGPNNGWYFSEWFGWFNGVSLPWVLHIEHGYVAVFAQSEIYYLYGQEINWLATRSSLYPYVYSYLSDGWLLYIENSDGQWFYDFNAGDYKMRSELGM